MSRLIFLILLLPSIQLAGLAQNFVKQSVIKSEPHTSEEYQSITFNGSWCWFSDPRAVYYEGQFQRTYTGWVDNYGDIHVAHYDHNSKEIHSRVICENLEIDDHDNPSILFDENGHLLVFFNMHQQGDQPLFLVKSLEAENIDSWTEIKKLNLNDESLKDMGSMNHTYTNPIKLSAENGRIFLFWRGVDGKPCFSTSENNGESWSKGKIFFMPERTYGFRRPYTKVYSDGLDKIHFVLTDGHPRNEEENSIYYMFYKGGSFYKADGSLIKTMQDLPVMPGEADMVYNAKTSNKGKAWNWDIAQDEKGDPVVAYVRFPNDSSHIYCYANYIKGKWNNWDLVNSGGWFPETPIGKTEPEPNYSGGISIDHESPNTLYLSVKRDSIFEIEKWETSNKGKSWKVRNITHGSLKNNVRPFAIRGALPDNPVQVLWMQNTRYRHYYHAFKSLDDPKQFENRFSSSIKMDQLSPSTKNLLKQEKIVQIMRRAADWQLANPYNGANRLDWEYGAFYTGIKALYEVTKEERYKNELLNIGQSSDWTPMAEVFHADRLTVLDNWAWLYGMEKDPKMIDKGQWALDIHLARYSKKDTDVRFKGNPYFVEWWTWCDALFMAPPSFVQMWKATGKEKYLDYMNTQWWKTSDYLFSTEDSLYYRDDRYFDKRTENGKKVFWARGNGWVIAGLARILTLLPEDYPDREKFEQQYQQMAQKLLRIQDEDGLWRVSLHDPDYLDIGESSGSSFFTFALAWGLNNGLVDEKFRPKVDKAWMALCKNVNAEGRLGYVQQVAGDPYPFFDYQWQVYGTGAFLLAGKEMFLLNAE